MGEMEAPQEQQPTPFGAMDSGFNWVGHAMETLIQIGKVTGKHVASAIPVVGAVTDLWGTGAGLYQANEGFQEEGLHSDDFYEGAGKTINNGTGFALQGAAAAVPAIALGASGLAGLVGGPGAALTVGAASTVVGTGTVAALEGANAAWNFAQAGIDVAGLGAELTFGADAGFNADQVMGATIRQTLGDESIGWSAGAAMSDAMGGEIGADILGGIAGTAINGIAAPLNIADAIIGASVNWGGDMADSNDEDDDYWQQMKDSMNPFAGMY